MLYYGSIPEEELKSRVGQEWFARYDHATITGRIDFSIYPKTPRSDASPSNPLLWAEAKTGAADLTDAMVQLVLTIGRARTFDTILPPPWLAAFNADACLFVPYHTVQHLFHLNDFNWNVAPSNHASREFATVRSLVEGALRGEARLFSFRNDRQALAAFIADALPPGGAPRGGRVTIDRNNFFPIYLRWLDAVKPCINVQWDELRAAGILDSDFFLADLFVDDKGTIPIDDDETARDSLFVVYHQAGYRIARENLRQLFDATISLRDREAYQAFWARYRRPPRAECQAYIIARRDLLVPQDIRERKGAYFTPSRWVELSQRYLALHLGQGWQEEYYVWDCAAGTGNLLAGLTNAPNLFASTLDMADVRVMRERADHGARLLRGHIFQFDFLNDPLTPQSQGGKLPDNLHAILRDPARRKRLIIYINPPYAEAGNARMSVGTGTNKKGVSNDTAVAHDYREALGLGVRELFAQFLVRIYSELPGCTIAEFSTLKILQGSAFKKFREFFRARLEGGFVVPASTFDNVKGEFPIGFKLWSTAQGEVFTRQWLDVYDAEGNPRGEKLLAACDGEPRISEWIAAILNDLKEDTPIGYTGNHGPDFQNNKYLCIESRQRTNRNGTPSNATKYPFTARSLLPLCVYFAVRKCMDTTWLNNQDQFYSPDDRWIGDAQFINNCFIYTLLHSKNNVKHREGANHWIPFTELEVGAARAFRSHFMHDFIQGKLGARTPTAPAEASLFRGAGRGDPTGRPLCVPREPMLFSIEARAVLAAARGLWSHYHLQPGANPDASLYDIREYFQGRNPQGRMNPTSPDPRYSQLLANLREAHSALREKIAPRVYEYGFLKG